MAPLATHVVETIKEQLRGSRALHWNPWMSDFTAFIHLSLQLFSMLPSDVQPVGLMPLLLHLKLEVPCKFQYRVVGGTTIGLDPETDLTLWSDEYLVRQEEMKNELGSRVPSNHCIVDRRSISGDGPSSDCSFGLHSKPRRPKSAVETLCTLVSTFSHQCSKAVVRLQFAHVSAKYYGENSDRK